MRDANADEDERSSRERFVRSTYAELFRWFHRLTGSSDLAADLTQESFARYWSNLDRKPTHISSRTWLYAIGRNLWRNNLRDRKSFEPSERAEQQTVEPTAFDEANGREFGEAVQRALATLPKPQREAFILRFWNDFNYDEIGAIQGVTAALARWRYFDARRRLNDSLAAWDPDPHRAKEDHHVS